MNHKLLASIESEVLGKEAHRGSQGGFWLLPFTVYTSARKALGQVPDIGVARFTFPKELHDELISDSRAKPHGAGFAGVVSYHIRESEDVPTAVELFRMNYERAKTFIERSRKACF